MALLYRCPAGRTITPDTWRALLGDASANGSILHQEEAYAVAMDYVGLASSAEHKPTFWLVRAWKLSPAGERKEIARFESWHETRRQATRAYEKAIERLESGEEN